VVKEALSGLKSGSGGIGACLVNEKTGEIVERGRNSQYTPHFRSDLHGEMDLLNRYEDRVKKKGGHNANTDPRRCDNLILFSSVEPCPMCLTRIINAGIKTMYYLIADETGGMARRMESLPPFWKTLAEKCDYRQAECAPALKQLADELFNFSRRSFCKMNASETEKIDGIHGDGK
jgi:tRNA(adenine34) deaminase